MQSVLTGSEGSVCCSPSGWSVVGRWGAGGDRARPGPPPVAGLLSPPDLEPRQVPSLRVVCVFQGDIYNFPELGQQLRAAS